MHLADVGNQEEESAVNLGLAANETSLLRDVDNALRRLDQQTYGRCEECGSPIRPERLEVLPYTRVCIDCAQKQ